MVGLRPVGDHDQLTSQGVRAICVCCREFEIPSKSFVPTIEYYRVDVEDMSKEPLEFFLEEATEPLRSFFYSFQIFPVNFFWIFYYFILLFLLCVKGQWMINGWWRLLYNDSPILTQVFKSHLFTSIHIYSPLSMILLRISFIHGTHKTCLVLVHCRAGVSRSASVVLAYMVRFANFNLNDAFVYLRAARPAVTPNLGFMEKLVAYEGHGWKRARHCNIRCMYRNVKKVVYNYIKAYQKFW